MTSMNRYMVWACFGVDADSPEQAKDIVMRAIFLESLDMMAIHDTHKINATVFISPKLDMLFGEGIDDDYL